MKQPVRQSDQSVLPGSVMHGELQHSFVKDWVGVDVYVLGDGKLDCRADADTLGHGEECLHPTGSVVT